jgi:hypothetical protein
MKQILLASALALGTMTTVALAETTTLTDAQMESVTAGKFTTSTETVKIPGPTDLLVTTATSPNGNPVPGQQSVTTVKNNQK